MTFAKKLFVLTVLLAAGLAVKGAQAAFVLQPTTYTTNMGGASYFKHVIDQSGLSTGYTRLVTDFDTYIAGSA